MKCSSLLLMFRFGRLHTKYSLPFGLAGDLFTIASQFTLFSVWMEIELSSDARMCLTNGWSVLHKYRSKRQTHEIRTMNRKETGRTLHISFSRYSYWLIHNVCGLCGVDMCAIVTIKITKLHNLETVNIWVN